MFTRCAWLVPALLIAWGCSPPSADSPAGDAAQGVQPPAASQGEGELTQDVAAEQSPDASAEQQQTPDAQEPQPKGEGAAVPPPSVEELLAQAQQAAQEGDFETAMKHAQGALGAEPNHREALMLLARFSEVHAFQLIRTGDREAGYPLFIEAAKHFRTLRETYGELNELVLARALYNEACAHAIAGESVKALASLREAFGAGFEDLELLESDDDLNALRDLPEFRDFEQQEREKLIAREQQRAKELMAQHEPFPFSFELPDLAGETVSLEDYRGKVLIVDIWGTWCPPCRREIPHFIKLHEKYRDAGLEIVGINYERVPEEKVVETIENFVANNDMTYRCVIGDEETLEMVPDFRGYPTTLFLDRAGEVRLKLVGYQPFLRLDAIVTQLIAQTIAPAAN